MEREKVGSKILKMGSTDTFRAVALPPYGTDNSDEVSLQSIRRLRHFSIARKLSSGWNELQGFHRKSNLLAEHETTSYARNHDSSLLAVLEGFDLGLNIRPICSH